MTQIVRIVDDIDGTGNAETVRFGLDRTEYEIDLAPKNRQRFLKMVFRYAGYATRVPANGKASGKTKPPRTAASRAETQAIRKWWASPDGQALTEGIPRTTRGRIPQAVRNTYEMRESLSLPAAPDTGASSAAASSGPHGARTRPGRKPRNGAR